jgi:nucleoid-associated protein YgaU
MQPIERYGVLALLFLVIAVAAVVFYDKKKSKVVPEVAPEVAATEGLDPSRPAWDPSVLPLSDPATGIDLGAPASPADPAAYPAIDPLTGLPVGPGSLQPSTTYGETVLPGATSATSPFGAGPATAPTLVAGPRDYTIRKGDTPSGIAARELGSSGRVSEILALNPGLDPKRLQIGQVLKLPAAGAAVPAAAASTTGRTYAVKAGDSFWSIAQSQLGDGSRHAEIAALNPGVDPMRLAAGTTLKLPAGSGSAPKVASSAGSTRPSTAPKSTTVARGKVQ